MHLAYCTHVCAGTARAMAASALPAKGPEPLRPGPSLRILADEDSSMFPTRGRGGGARAALWEAEPGGVARGARIRAQREVGRGPARWGAVAPRCR